MELVNCLLMYIKSMGYPCWYDTTQDLIVVQVYYKGSYDTLACQPTVQDVTTLLRCV